MYDSARGGSDTLTVTNFGDNSSAQLFGDAHTMNGGVQGGNDTLTVTNAGLGSHAELYGDALQMENGAQGGNDLLIAIDSGLGSSATLFGDASVVAHGGNDTLIGGRATILCTAMPNSTLPLPPARSPAAPTS